MKNIFKLGFVFITMFAAFSCSDVEDDRVTIYQTGSPALVKPVDNSSYVFTEDKASQLAEQVVWTGATYTGAKVEVFYDVELVTTVLNKQGVAEEKITSIVQTTNDTINLSVETFNAGVIKAGVPPNVPTDVGIRVTSSLGTNFGAKQSSITKTINVTAYPTWPDWGIIGTCIPGNDWTNDEDLAYDAITDTYSITLDMITASDVPASSRGFKFRLDNAWTVNLGGSSYDKLSTNNAPNLQIPEDGNYTITLKIETDDTGKVIGGVATVTKN